MITTLIIFSITLISLILSTIFCPTIKLFNKDINLYYIIALIGALFMFIFKVISFDDFIDSIKNSNGMNPVEILILFLSMNIISLYLDKVGFFDFIANFIVSKCKATQKVLFITIFFLVAVLTIFTSNDIVIFTLTPFIISFSKKAKISPIPYLVSEFASANTWSMLLLIGNPTNMYLTQSFDINFIDYFKVMALPTLVSGITELFILLLIFRKDLRKNIEINIDKDKTYNYTKMIIGLVSLIITIILLIISNYINIKMHIICFIMMILLVIFSFIYSLIKEKNINDTLYIVSHASYELIPFILSMFVLIIALDKNEIVTYIFNLLNNRFIIPTYGFMSFLSSNLLNNIPMSILFSKILQGFTSLDLIKGAYATVIGSNIGAFLSPLGALAGIMWLSILKKNNIKFSFVDFIKKGILISIPVLVIALLMLMIII